MSISSEFKEFAMKGNVVDLAVGVVIGGAFGKIVTAFVDDLIMPVVGAILPGGDWRAYSVSPLNLKVGHLFGAVLDFVIIAMVMFVVIVKMMGALNKKPQTAPAAASTKSCGECLEAIPLLAKRCRACGSTVAA